MKVKKYALLFSTFLFIITGAAMPYFASQMQDIQISGFQKTLELSTVSLTLRQENDVLLAVQLIAREHSESRWEGKTVLSKADASRAALAVMESLNQYDLLPEDDLERFLESERYVEPHLLVDENGSSVLIWACTWDYSPGTFITIEDTTGEAVRILTKTMPMDSSNMEEDIFIQLEKWYVFLQDYYDIELTEAKEDAYRSSGSLPASFVMCFSSKDGTTDCELNLNITDGYTFFNYQ